MAKALVLDERSKRPLSEVARFVVAPTGIVDSTWFDLEERYDEWGIRFDTWQDGAGQLLLGTRADGRYAATVGGSTFSIARQVAKTFLVSRATFGLCAYEDDQTWLWTAHRVRTATQTFQKLAGFAQSKRVRPYMAPGATNGIRSTNGEQEIRFRNGSRILFGAREAGFGRGFDEVDGEVFDEGQILTEKALEDMIPAMNQSRNPRGALAIFMGTPPRPVDPGDVMKARRRKALGSDRREFEVVTRGDALYIEFSADQNVGRPGGPSLDDPEQIKLANPSYPHRTPPESVARMRENLASDEAWRREALGVWDSDESGTRAISTASWDATAVERAPGSDSRSYGVAFSADGDRIAVGGAVQHEAGEHVELIDAVDGDVESAISNLADWFVAVGPTGEPRWKAADSIVFSGGSGALVLRQLLVERGVSHRSIRVATTPQYLTACGMFDEGVRARTVTHLASEGQGRLDASVAVTDKDKRGGWSASTADGDETPLEAVSVALWASRTSKKKRSHAAVFR
ncbi:hypothetical protein AB0230_01875 [Microbacterium sp. NPDC089190]|uniref:hypothetical protein n=1 Tax=Microbacterium sp. NPDC089190 TaxID=3155063 RepID=UPI003450B9E6